MQNERASRFKKIEKIIQLQQKDLVYKLNDLKNLINKKKQSIAVVEKYLAEYEAKFNQISAISVANLQNFQSFLNKIVTVLNQEQEALRQLNIKQEELFVEYLKGENRIKAINEHYIQ